MSKTITESTSHHVTHVFPASPIAALNEHTCQQSKANGGGGATAAWDWYLVVDKFEFHVYVAAVCRATRMQVRCDWHQNTSLTFNPFQFDKLEQNLLIGHSDWFCRCCIVEQIDAIMKEVGARDYRLFHFNCRSMSYLILWRIMGFPHELVYGKFDELHILCGLDPSQCLKLAEIRRYFAYKKENRTECVLF